jgi:hypothetical protein
MQSWVFAALLGAVLPLGSASAGTLQFMPTGEWAQKLAESEMSELRGAGFGIAFDISITGSIESLAEFENLLPTTLPEGFGISVSNGTASITTVIGGINGNGIFIFNQIPGSLNVVNTTVVINIAINGLN